MRMATIRGSSIVTTLSMYHALRLVEKSVVKAGVLFVNAVLIHLSANVQVERNNRLKPKAGMLIPMKRHPNANALYHITQQGDHRLD